MDTDTRPMCCGIGSHEDKWWLRQTFRGRARKGRGGLVSPSLSVQSGQNNHGIWRTLDFIFSRCNPTWNFFWTWNDDDDYYDVLHVFFLFPYYVSRKKAPSKISFQWTRTLHTLTHVESSGLIELFGQVSDHGQFYRGRNTKAGDREIVNYLQ